jgi:tRNA-modifying protein YgfZ
MRYLMPPAKIALLSDRGVVHVTGDDAETFLQGLVTSDVAGPAAVQPKTVPAAVHAGLLSPPGKILFEVFVVGLGGGFLLEAARERIPDLIKRLGMYKLRAKVAIEDASNDWAVAAVWGGPFASGFNATHFGDPRLPALGIRWLVPRSLLERLIEGHVQAGEAVRVDEGEYHAYRIALGVPEGGKDYAFGDTFPHEANFDVLNGVSFTKGCFVGQEVVSRMQHRGTARKRIVIIEGEAPLRPGGEVMAGDATIGKVGSVAGNRGLALVRLDRAEEATRKGGHLTAGGSPITLRVPDYLQSAQPAAAQ